MKDTANVIVVGAGAAGQLAAIAAASCADGGADARAGQARRVVVLEQMDRPGLKILASGGGRCNLTRMVEPEAFYSAFGRKGRFMSAAFDLLPPPALREFFAGLGVRTVEEEGGLVYPSSRLAKDVEDALRRRMDELGVELTMSAKVEDLVLENGAVAGVRLAGDEIRSPRVILACGGRSWPRLGGTGSGYHLARQAGHGVVEPLPALVPLVTRERWPTRLAGVSLDDVEVRLAVADQAQDASAGRSRTAARKAMRDISPSACRGGLLFTHRGISGPAVLNVSGSASQMLRLSQAGLLGQACLEISFLPGQDRPNWTQRLNDYRSADGTRPVGSLLGRHLPSRLAEAICELAGIDTRMPIAHLKAEGRDELSRLLAACPLTITGTEGFDTAFVTRGGVDLKEVDPRTLESRLAHGLYFAGEVLDLDGPTGGYNLQWAFASGYLAGMSAGR